MKRFKSIMFILLICCLIIGSSIKVLGNAVHLYSGGFSSTIISNLKYVMSGGDSTYQWEIMEKGAQRWNGISSKVKASYGTSGTRLSIYKSSSSVPDLFGQALFYKSDWSQASIYAVWSYASVKLYDNQMNNAGFTLENKRSCMAHEMGHILSLNHTNDIPSPELMDPGKDLPSWPTSIDIGHLKLKWGY